MEPSKKWATQTEAPACGTDQIVEAAEVSIFRRLHELLLLADDEQDGQATPNTLWLFLSARS